jgi:uncharacterized protein
LILPDSSSPASPRHSHIQFLYKHRAIIINENNKRHLVVGDLHIGFEEKFRLSGISLQPRIDNLIGELEALIKEQEVTNLLVNGDVKSGTDRISRYEWENVPKFFSRMAKLCQVSVIPGNHDGGLQYLIPPEVNLLDSNGIIISNVLVLHGHTRPLLKFQDCEQLVMGHVHPIFQRKGNPLSGQPVWVFLRANRTEIFKQRLTQDEALSANMDTLEIILMPSFNLELVVAGFAIDTARQERKIAPILRSLRSVSEAMITTLDGELIGDASLLPNIL